MSRPLIVMLLTVFSLAAPARAFEDAAVHGRLRTLRAELARESSASDRLKSFDRFGDFLEEHLEKVTLAHTAKGEEEFASLNEFAVSFFAVDLDPVNATNCRLSREKVLSEGRVREGGLENGKVSYTPAALLTLELVNLVCR
ncbi:MAG: hypothetical protein KF802_05985 [Bdellovibrionaceae bacterium]|nr:hypothetical protein [Pseudobdellovibrionaceae bacterium]MBX3032469.1 hypothetical protein [Pseudobdellovibrionaceae bacterium]